MPLITSGEKILHSAIYDVVLKNTTCAYTTLNKALVDFADNKTLNRFRWNAPDTWEENNTVAKTRVPRLAGDCDSPSWANVRGSNYGEVSALLNTSGCSKEHPNYTWTVLGIVEDRHGKQIVHPGDWLVELYPGRAIVVPHDEYVKMFVE